ncbi:prepilin-type N-terminal cleavage/methylation domain-containing protein [Desulfitobacterium sp. THU1]|uniref:PilW family protein n=1 Tax=Desulfitobacterium sp. THU1 TaxID=3138072 RepID=UPI00311E4064
MMNRDKGFTILEVMMAIVIFGFLMMMVAQIFNGELSLMNATRNQSELEQKARTAMVHILDEIKLNDYTYYSTGAEGYNYGVYTQAPDHPQQCLINLKPAPAALAGDHSAFPTGTRVYYNHGQRELWYRDEATNSVNLIADDIDIIEIFPETSRLLRIYVKATDSTGSEYELLTWSRAY